MSFSGKTKEELERKVNKARHCQISEIAGMVCFLGKIIQDSSGIEIRLETENEVFIRRYAELVRKAFQCSVDIQNRGSGTGNRNQIYFVNIAEDKTVKAMLQALKINIENCMDEKGTRWLVDQQIIERACCKRAYIRGVFLAAGSITDPEKGYHFEVVCSNEDRAEQFARQLAYFGVEGKTIERKGHTIVYVKEGSQIVDVLNIMEAHHALMELENIRILKEVRNTINRKVNCETANINKTVSAAVKQIEDIEYIRDHVGLDSLSPALEQVAQLRLEYPEAPLKELGEMLNPPVGKSGVNHRLRKLSNIAEELRN